MNASQSRFRCAVEALTRCVGRSVTLSICSGYAETLYKDDDATLDDLREAVTTLEDATRTARRVLGGAHPDVLGIGNSLQEARAALRARETPSPGGSA